jgi:hypothetical protein
MYKSVVISRVARRTAATGYLAITCLPVFVAVLAAATFLLRRVNSKHLPYLNDHAAASFHVVTDL